MFLKNLISVQPLLLLCIPALLVTGMYGAVNLLRQDPIMASITNDVRFHGLMFTTISMSVLVGMVIGVLLVTAKKKA